MLTENQYLSLDATEMAKMVKNGDITHVELVDASTQRKEKVNPTLNAVIYDRNEHARNQQHSPGPFSGVPLLLKNISQTIKGEPMTAGAKLMKGNIAKQDSYLVQKLREQGFVFTGYTNTPEFGLKNITEPELFGPTRNPWNVNHSPGGSSGGSAAAVASGIVPMVGASDGGGSIRIPASFTGLFGLKPTRGRMPVGPGIGRQWQGAATDFVLSRTVRDSAVLLDGLQVLQPEAAFHWPRYEGVYADDMSKPFSKPLRIAFSNRSPVGTEVSEDAKEALQKVLTFLETEGHEVEEVDNGIDGVALMEQYYLMNSGEMSALRVNIEESLGRSLTPDDIEIETWVLSEAGQTVSAATFTRSLAAWDTAAAKMAEIHDAYDLYLTPATAYTAPSVGELTHSQAERQTLIRAIEREKHDPLPVLYDMFLPSLTYSPFSQLANLTGQPAASMPVHIAENGLPIGVQAMASKGNEDLLLRLAHQLEQSDLWEVVCVSGSDRN
ncbi:amidase [Salicibibacter cibarius]|uniref:Amidase n=1 Tax=Salicibibacter cibarius TaxID=2743000 RepID=A0A7T6Z7A8_9BACI|nr:amidase [Salicibibacter cibarius]QQK78157.1 amidase [Salicibibacter cibarius]